MSIDIGKKIRKLRREKGMTQEDLSAKIKYKISRSTLSNYEVGRRTPHLTDLRIIASALDVGLDYFNVDESTSAFEVFTRAKELFKNPNVSTETKEELYLELLRLYIELKGEEK